MPTELNQPLMMPNHIWKRLYARMTAINAVALAETGMLPLWVIDEAASLGMYWDAVMSLNGISITITAIER